MKAIRESTHISGFLYDKPLAEVSALTHCGEALCARGHSVKIHAHPGFEFHYLSRGGAYGWQVGGKTFEQKSGEIFVTYPQEPHLSGACANPDPNIGPSGCVFGANISPYRLDNLSVPRGDLAALAIRSDGTTCGQDNNAAIAIWSSNGTEIFHDSFGDGSACEALNDYGVAVGNFYSPTFVTGSLAFVYDPVSGVRDLNNLITNSTSLSR